MLSWRDCEPSGSKAKILLSLSVFYFKLSEWAARRWDFSVSAGFSQRQQAKRRQDSHVWRHSTNTESTCVRGWSHAPGIDPENPRQQLELYHMCTRFEFARNRRINSLFNGGEQRLNNPTQNQSGLLLLGHVGDSPRKKTERECSLEQNEGSSTGLILTGGSVESQDY